MKKLLLTIILCLLCISCYSNTLYSGITETGKNDKEYIRQQWIKLLGFDIFYGILWVKDTQSEIAKEAIKYIGLNKSNWDLNIKVSRKEIKIKISKEF